MLVRVTQPDAQTAATNTTTEKIASFASNTGTSWTRFSTQTSRKIYLEKGATIYLTAYMREWSGGDSLSVGISSDVGTDDKPAKIAPFRTGKAKFTLTAKFADTEPKDGANPCPAHTYASGANCVACAEGEISAAGATACSCPAGSATINGKCQLCPKGSFSTAAASTSCTNCPEGQTTSDAGATASTACAASDIDGNIDTNTFPSHFQQEATYKEAAVEFLNVDTWGRWKEGRWGGVWVRVWGEKE